MSTSTSHAPLVEASPSKSRTLRTTALVTSAVLHVVILGLMLFKPIQFSPVTIDPKDISPVLGEIAQPDGGVAEASPTQQNKSNPRARAIDKLPKPIAKKARLPAHTQDIATPPKSERPVRLIRMVNSTSLASFDVAELVAKMIGAPNTDEPIDFDVQGGEAVTQMPASAMTSLAGLLSAGSSQNCNAANALQMALQEDVLFKEALREIPRDDRSVANVIMAWDGQWIDTIANHEPSDRLANDLVFPQTLKQRIQDYVRTSSIECLNEIIEGPAFILISDDMETTILAFGSGTWKWVDVVANDQPLAPSKSSAAVFDALPNLIHR